MKYIFLIAILFALNSSVSVLHSQINKINFRTDADTTLDIDFEGLKSVEINDSDNKGKLILHKENKDDTYFMDSSDLDFLFEILSGASPECSMVFLFTNSSSPGTKKLTLPVSAIKYIMKEDSPIGGSFNITIKYDDAQGQEVTRVIPYANSDNVRKDFRRMYFEHCPYP